MLTRKLWNKLRKGDSLYFVRSCHSSVYVYEIVVHSVQRGPLLNGGKSIRFSLPSGEIEEYDRWWMSYARYFTCERRAVSAAIFKARKIVRDIGLDLVAATERLHSLEHKAEKLKERSHAKRRSSR